MSVTTETEITSAIAEKTRDLCQAILDDSEVKGHLSVVETFLADEDAKQLYRDVMDHSGMLQHRQSQGDEIAQAEIESFERMRESLMNNSVAKAFLGARESLHSLQKTVNLHLDKTIELGRMPTDEEIQESGCCGGEGGGGG